MIKNKSKNEQWFEAIKQWGEILEPKAILLKKEAIAPYTKNTIGISRSIKGILLPRSKEEVQAIVKIAQKYMTPLYTISGGKNWGYGSCNPIEKTSFIIDLSNMNKIKDFDKDLGVVTVEPGVTQQDLYEFFQKNGGEFMVPTTGAGPSASILGNALERGYGLTPHSDHFEAITSFNAVLPNGDFYKPALEELGGKKINQLFKWGLGPYMDGLFTQGNFGIVTEGTLLIARRPETVSTFIFSLKEDASLEGAISAIRKIRSNLGGNTGAINLMNARRMLSMIEPSPKTNSPEQSIISDEEINNLAKKHQLTEWTGFGAIYGKKEMTRAIRKIIKKELKPHVKRIHFISKKTIKVVSYARFIAPSFYKNHLKPILDLLTEGLRNCVGVPSQVALPLAYCLSEKPANLKTNLDPARDNCGLIWHAPLVPLTPSDIRKHVDIINKVCPKYNINPLITLTVFSEQCCDSTIPILFNKDEPQNEFNAKACHDELLRTEGEEGYFPYRLGVDKMKQLIDPTLPCWQLASTLKKAIDPHQIIAPGRYTPYQENELSTASTENSSNQTESISF